MTITLRGTVLTVILSSAALAIVGVAGCIRSDFGFQLRNKAADAEFTRIASGFPREEEALREFRKAGLHAGKWGRAPDQYYAVWRKPTTNFDRLSDRYYMLTDRGSRRLIGMAFFDGQSTEPENREMTSYTRSLSGGKVYKRLTVPQR